MLIDPLQYLQVFFVRMLTPPLDPFAVLDTGFGGQIPQLNRIGKHTVMVVHPIIERTGGNLLGVVFEVVESRDTAIPGDLGADLSDFLKDPQVLGIHIIV